MKAVCSNKALQAAAGRGAAMAIFVSLFAAFQLQSTAALAYETPKNLREGWDGDVQLGALATFGPTDSSAITARSVLSYRKRQWEHELDARFYRSTSEAILLRRDKNGDVLKDANGEDLTHIIRSTTNDRRFLSGQSRWFFATHFYVFAFADIDVNTPANLHSATRQIGGVGYKLWRSKSDVLSAAVGIGRKKREEVSGNTEEGAIGYLGFRYKRAMSDKMTLSLDVDSDFGDDNRYSEAEASLSIKLRDPISVKLKYEIRFNSTVLDPLNTFDDGLQSALSVNMAVAVF